MAQFVRDGQIELDIEEKAKHIDLISVETEFKYEGYLKRQNQQVEKSKRNEGQRIPDNVDFASLPGLSVEVVERLTQSETGNTWPGIKDSRRNASSSIHNLGICLQWSTLRAKNGHQGLK